MTQKEVGELIKNRRDLLKLRQEDLSELSGINMRTVNLTEQGKGNPSFTTLSKLAEVLGLEVLIAVKKTN